MNKLKDNIIIGMGILGLLLLLMLYSWLFMNIFCLYILWK